MVQLTLVILVLFTVPVEHSRPENEAERIQLLFFCHRILWSFANTLNEVHNDQKSQNKLCRAYSNDYYVRVPGINDCPDYYIYAMAEFNNELKGICPGVLGILLPHIYDERITQPVIVTRSDDEENMDEENMDEENVDAGNVLNKSCNFLPDEVIGFAVAIGSLVISNMRLL